MIIIQNFDSNECFKWCWVIYLHSVDHHPARIRKIEKLIEDVRSPVNIRDIHKIEKKNSIVINIFGYENKKKEIFALYVKKCYQKTFGSVIIRRKRQKLLCYYQDFNTFMHNHTLHRGRKYFCCYWNNIWNKLKYLYFL